VLRNYEAVVIVDSRLDEPSIKQAVEKFTKAIEGKGEIVKLEEWGRRRFAFEIDHMTEGFYVVASFKAEPSLIEELNRLMQLGEEYIRHKVVRVP
jgi:small subunit ribosomal protein S6